MIIQVRKIKDSTGRIELSHKQLINSDREVICYPYEEAD